MTSGCYDEFLSIEFCIVETKEEAIRFVDLLSKYTLFRETFKYNTQHCVDDSSTDFRKDAQDRIKFLDSYKTPSDLIEIESLLMNTRAWFPPGCWGDDTAFEYVELPILKLGNIKCV